MFAFVDALAKTVPERSARAGLLIGKRQGALRPLRQECCGALVNGPHPFLRGEVEP